LAVSAHSTVTSFPSGSTILKAISPSVTVETISRTSMTSLPMAVTGMVLPPLRKPFRQEAFRDLPPFADHSVVDLRAHAFIVVDPLKPNIEQFDTKHSNFLRSLGKDFLLHQFASLLYWHQRPLIHPSRIAREGVAQRNAILGGADDPRMTAQKGVKSAIE